MFCGTKAFSEYLVDCLKKDFQIRSLDTNDIMFTGQRLRWVDRGDKQKEHISVDQDLKVEEISEIEIPREKMNNATEALDSWLHTKYRSLLGKINWIQSRTRFDSAYDFSRCASKAANPTIDDLRNLNILCRKIRATLRFWPLSRGREGSVSTTDSKPKWRLVGYPDAGYQNKKPDKTFQRGQCIFL